MAKAPKKLDELFHDTLKDIYYAEKKILSTLPKMAKAARSPELKAAFEKHRGETEGHVERLEQVFAIINQKPQGKTCAAIVGITDEGAEIMQEYEGSPALDAGLLAAAQAVEHYEMSRYGTLRTWAEELGLTEAASLLEETLDEEEATDAALTKIAESVVNHATAAASDMAKSASQQVTTFASELEAMTKRNPLGTLAGAVIAGVLIGILARGRT